MQGVLEDLVRLTGWVLLKALTCGRYQSTGPSAILVEGASGLLAIAGGFWALFLW
jgi:hypothetical protein